MRKTEKAIYDAIEAKKYDLDILDLIHKHFEAIRGSLADYQDVCDEGRKLLGSMLGGEIEELSHIDSVLDGIAAASAATVCDVIGRLLGFEGRVIDTVVQDFAPEAKPGAGITELIATCEEVKRFLAALDEAKTEEELEAVHSRNPLAE